MAASVAFLFPGQGSQFVGMGKGLAERYALARDVFAEADDVLECPLSQLCFEGPLDDLTLTTNTQPALLTLSTAITRVIGTELGVYPSWVAGHSLGEISALVAAGAMRFADALRVVRERGRAMQEAVPPGIGTMAAVLGLEAADIDAVCREAAGDQVVSAANFNGGGQIVIAGHREAVDRAATLAKERGAKRVLPLTVSAPFHCSLMEPAARHLQAVLAGVDVSEPQCPVITNVEAKANTDAGRIKNLLVRQVVSPVRWQESVEELERLGCTKAIEAGPGKALTGLVKRIAASIRCVGGEDLTAIEALLASD